MTVEERRRAQLQEAATKSWGQEAADTLMELVTPAGQEMATRADIRGVLAALDAVDERWDARFAAFDQRLAAMDSTWGERLAAMDERWSERFAASDKRWSERLTASDEAGKQRSETLEHRLDANLERGIKEAITAQTRALVVSVLVAVVAIAGLAFGLAG